MKRIRIMVCGYVQGVFFRHNTKKTALSLGLKGYARNMPDGSVEVVAEGPEDKLKGLIAFCKKGPEAAKVSKAEVNFEKATGEFSSFEIVH